MDDDTLVCKCGSDEWIGGGLIELLSGIIYCAKCGADEPNPPLNQCGEK